MSNQNVIWLRDALVITLSIYVVFSITAAPWSNLRPIEPIPVTCATGCAPTSNYPEDGYYHYKDSIVFEWNPVSVGYRFTVLDTEGNVVHNENLTDITTFTTMRLSEGNYTSFIYYKGIFGSQFGDNEPLLRPEEKHVVAPNEKITLVWAPVEVTYGIVIREHRETEHLIVHQVEDLNQTSYEFTEFINGKTYSWSIYATDSEGFVSESSNEKVLNIDTTKFLAYELFNHWEAPFIFLGILMVVALQAGVFLAREESDD